MIADHLIKLIKQNLGHIPTAGQETLIGMLVNYILDSRKDEIFIVKGFAGTGKTTLISALVKTLEDLKFKTLLLAPTGRAAKVFSGYANKSAYTIHRKIYKQKSSNGGFGKFVPGKNLSSNMIIIVDEASMISDSISEQNIFGTGHLLSDLIGFVKDGNNNKLILVGDTAQLPPVGSIMSPALNKNELSFYMTISGEFELTDIVRQNHDSDILQNATIVRNLINKNKIIIPPLISKKEVHFINGNEILPVLEDSFNKYGMEEVIVICRSNKKANQYNDGIRKYILFRDEDINAGDMLMVVKNNYFALKNQPESEFIANGDIIRIIKIKKYTERYGFRFAFASMELIDYNRNFEAWILLDTLTSESSSLTSEDNRKLYYNLLEDYIHIKTKSGRYKAIREDVFFNALQVKFAYAVTCHKAQGGQWKVVFVDQGYITPEKTDIEYLRWLYTAVTRATEILYFVNFSK